MAELISTVTLPVNELDKEQQLNKGSKEESTLVDPHGKHRERWATKFDFMLACVGYAIGYGNVWRFPYLVYKNGGGAFLIPFFVSVVLGGIPVFFLEVMQGQFIGGGAVKVWNMAPIFQGIGFACLVIASFSAAFYNILQTWSIRYFFASFAWVLPWETCDHEWNTEYCVTGVPKPVVDENNATIGYLSWKNVTFAHTLCIDVIQMRNSHFAPVTAKSNRVLAISDGITEVGSIKPDLLLCLVVAWLIVYFCIFKGIRTSGRITYFTVPAPFVLMIVLVVRGLTLPGAWDGVVFYLRPDWSKIGDILVWADAGTQVLYSYSVSLGVLHALGSFNPWHHSSFRDTIIFGFMDALICIVSGLITFPVLGYMAQMKGVEISEVAEQGPGLAFVVYPTAISLMPFAPVWAVIFFAMLILVGIDSEFVGIEAFIATVTDLLPKNMRKAQWQRAVVVAVTCLIYFLGGLPMITNGGMYVFQIVDYYAGCRIIMLVAMFECIAVGWFYGSGRFCRNMEIMWKIQMPRWAKTAVMIMWNFVTPLFVLSQFIINSIQYSKSLTYKRNANTVYEYPGWAIALGWMLAYSSVICIPIVAVYRIIKVKNQPTLLGRIRYLTLPILKPYMVLPEAKSGSYVPDRDEDAPEGKDLLMEQDDQIM